MSKKHTEMMARIGMAGAVVPTYLEQIAEPNEVVKRALNSVDFHTQKAIHLYGKVGKQNLEKIGSKIDLMREETCLGKACSILTFVAYAVNVLERALDGEGRIANIGGSVGRKAIMELVFSLCGLHLAITKNPHVRTCQKAGERAAEIWDRMEV